MVFASIESALQLRAFTERFAPPAAAPTWLTMPFTILASRALRPSSEPHERPISVLFTGRPFSSFDGSRAAVYEQLKAAGALCRNGIDGRVTCALCDQPAACAQVFEELRLQAHEDPSVFGAQKVLALASHATLCVEPTSDTLVRSHFYAAVLAGCVPVIFDPSSPMPAPFRSDHASYQTEWAWRHYPFGASRCHGSCRAVAQLTNYSRFALIERVGEARGRRVRADLVSSLHRLATSPEQRPQLRSLQTALGAVAPLMGYEGSGSECASSTTPLPCDAFSMLVVSLRALVLGKPSRPGKP